ncbi:glycosylated lysosomal membrane protein [Hoplias malabaricus]|uniref:glycosylated lysosomal membrane protein n=1 Tax=Hoplias malabaricus TaxID=27720 RepID=UPI003461D5F6
MINSFKPRCFLAVLFYTLGFVYGSMGKADSFRRKVSLELNPGLKPSSTTPPGVDLLHARAVGDNDTLHFLFCTVGAPGVLLVHTNSTQSSVTVNWPVFLSRNASGSLRVEPEDSVQYSSVLVFTRLLEYDDLNNTADPQTNESIFLESYNLQDFSWSDMNSTLNLTLNTVKICGRNKSYSFSNGSLCLQFSAFESEGREEAWPSLPHTANTSQLHVWLEGVMPRANQSRFVLELQTVNRAGFQTKIDVHRFIDDEYTPSIFQVSEWQSSPANSTSFVGGFSQWKPVAYRKKTPVLEDATPCKNSPPTSLDRRPPSALVSAYFTHNPIIHGINISFSVAGDPFYSSTHFLSWTLLMGMGTPPSDFFSPLVMAIMAIGLGTPLVLILVGGVYVCIRKKDPSSYEPIN